MALDLTFMADDVRDATSDIPSTFTFGAESCGCVASPIRRANDVQDIGEFLNFDLEASLAVADLPAGLPIVRDSVTVDNVIYYVESREVDSHVARFTLKRKA